MEHENNVGTLGSKSLWLNALEVFRHLSVIVYYQIRQFLQICWNGLQELY